MMLHIDGSKHQWLAGQWHDLIVVDLAKNDYRKKGGCVGFRRSKRANFFPRETYIAEFSSKFRVAAAESRTVFMPHTTGTT
jgi:hypothetical protein